MTDKQIAAIEAAAKHENCARNDGIEAVALMLQKKADDYASERGVSDMGSLEFGNDAMRDYHWNLLELVDEVRSMKDAAAPAAPTEGARIGEPDYKARFETMVYMIGEITQALGISDEEAACANGNDVILSAISELKGQRDNFADDAYALAFEGARDAGVGTAVGRFIKASEYGPWMETSSLVDGQPLYARPDPLLAECVEALERVTLFLADERMGSWRYIEGGEFYGDLSDEVAALNAILAKVQAAKEGKS